MCIHVLLLTLVQEFHLMGFDIDWGFHLRCLVGGWGVGNSRPQIQSTVQGKYFMLVPSQRKVLIFPCLHAKMTAMPPPPHPPLSHQSKIIRNLSPKQTSLAGVDVWRKDTLHRCQRHSKTHLCWITIISGPIGNLVSTQNTPTLHRKPFLPIKCFYKPSPICSN